MCLVLRSNRKKIWPRYRKDSPLFERAREPTSVDRFVPARLYKKNNKIIGRTIGSVAHRTNVAMKRIPMKKCANAKIFAGMRSCTEMKNRRIRQIFGNAIYYLSIRAMIDRFLVSWMRLFRRDAKIFPGSTTGTYDDREPVSVRPHQRSKPVSVIVSVMRVYCLKAKGGNSRRSGNQGFKRVGKNV